MSTDTPIRPPARALACAIAALSLLSGCPAEDESFALAVSLVSPPDQDPLEGVDVLEMDVDYASGDSITYYQAPAEGSWDVDQVPAPLDGESASLSFRGMAFDPADDGNVLEIANGASEAVDLVAGGEVHVYFSQRHRFGRVDGPLARKRVDPVAVALPGGGALVLGGRTGAEPVDAPSTGGELLGQEDDGRWGFEDLDGDVHRYGAAALAVDSSASPFDGRVLLIGGWEQAVDGDSIVARVDALDVGDGSLENAFTLPTGVALAVLTPLDDGRLLLSGGVLWESGQAMPSGAYMVVDPDQGQSTLSGGMARHRYQHGAAALDDGTVLVCGGLRRDGDVERSTAECEIWSLGGVDSESEMDLVEARTAFAMVALPAEDGARVLAAGGHTDDGDGAVEVLDSAELYDTASGRWSALDARMTEPRDDPRTVALPDGRVMLCGGLDADGTPLESCELFDPAVEAFVPLPAVDVPGGRAGFALVELAGGLIALVGGDGGDAVSAYLYNP